MELDNTFDKKFLIILNIKIAYIASNIIEPINPNSSENNVNIKSVCFSGKNSKYPWVPFKKPFPKRRPDPTAIYDWIIWEPAPKGSLSGSKKVRILNFW